MLMICETNFDNSSPNGQIQVKGFKTPFRLDRDKNGGSTMMFMRKYILTKHLLMDKFLLGDKP